MENEERHRKIVIEFISNNQGCTAQQLVDGVNTELSRVPVFKTLGDLKAEGLVQDRKRNRRDHRFFVDGNNPLIFIPKQLEGIETIFKKLLDKSKPHWDNLTKQRLNALEESDIGLIGELFFKGTVSLIHFVPTMILQMITDFVTIHARTIWINKIADKDTLNELFSIVFMKLASLNTDYVDYLNSIQYKHLETVQLDNSAVNRVYLPLQLMYISRNVYKEIGMEKEIEGMFDLLWKFSEDIRMFLFPEIKLYKWDSKYNIRSWRDLLEIYKDNPDQTAQNYYLLKKQ